MASPSPVPDSVSPSPPRRCIGLGLALVGLFYGLLLAVNLISHGLGLWVGDRLGSVFTFAQNPWLGLLVGIFATALVQSSSAVTTILVGLVASGLPVAIAVPMVMGANIGTTVTNTVASFGFLRQQGNFEKALAAATIHDFFNLLALALLLPTEIAFHGIEKTAAGLTAILQPWLHGPALGTNGLTLYLDWPHRQLIPVLAESLPAPWPGVIITGSGGLLLLLSILNLGRVLQTLLGAKPLTWLTALLPNAPSPLPLPMAQALIPLAVGGGITCLVQSSSLTTSLLVPLAATDLMPLTVVYAVTLGANLGTCITSVLAAIALVPPSPAALEIALVHVLFNLGGIVLIYGLPWLRPLPLRCAQQFARLSGQNTLWAIGYLLSLFFLIPLLGFSLGGGLS